MALTGYPKTINSPYIHYLSPGDDAIVGVFDYVKVVSDVSTDYCIISVKDASNTTEVAHDVTAGDGIYGPFTSVEVDTGTSGSDIEVLVYERSKTVDPS